MTSTSAQKANDGFNFIGVATLKDDNQICLQMRTEEPGKPVAEGYFCYKETDPDYKRIRDHVGPIPPGGEKVFGPFNND